LQATSEVNNSRHTLMDSYHKQRNTYTPKRFLVLILKKCSTKLTNQTRSIEHSYCHRLST